MATFFTALAPGHAIRVMTAPALRAALQIDPNVAGVIPALASARREWAAAAEYLGDVNIIKDVAALSALSPAQRSVLCTMLGVIPSASAATSAARILRNLGPGLAAQAATPWLDLLTAAGYPLLVAEAAKPEAQLTTELALTPFLDASVGLSGLTLRELSHCALWASAYLVDDAAWVGLSVARRAELRQGLGVPAGYSDDWARTASLAVCSTWQGRAVGPCTGVTAAIGAAVGTGGPVAAAAPSMATTAMPVSMAGAARAGTGGGRFAFPRASTSVSAMEGSDIPWWRESVAGGGRGAKQLYTGIAQNNILSPPWHYLGRAAGPGAGVTAAIVGAAVGTGGSAMAPPIAASPATMAGAALVGAGTGGGRDIFLLPSTSVLAMKGSDMPWWRESAAGGSSCAKQLYTGFAQNNILSPHYLGEISVYGSSVFEKLIVGSEGSMTEAIRTGCGADKSAKTADTLRALLSATLELVVDADALLTTEEVDELKAARKAEAVDRRRATGPFSAYPWLQSLAEGRRHVGWGDPFTLGRQMAVALRVDAPNKGIRLDILARVTREQKLNQILQDFTDGYQAGDIVAVLSAFEKFKEMAKVALRAAFNEARQLAINFPECVEIREVCAGRQLQLERLHLVWMQLSSTPEDREGGSNNPGGGSAWLAGCLWQFMGGVRAPIQSAAHVPAITGRVGTFGAAGNWSVAVQPPAPAAQTGGAAGGSRGCCVPAPTTGPGSSHGTPPAARGAGIGGTASGRIGPGTRGGGGLLVGMHFPASKQIVGTHIGINGPVKNCWACSKVGHFRGECPGEYGKLGLGQALPGWDRDGAKIPGAWNGDEPRRKTFVAWVAFLTNRAVYPSGGAVGSGLRGAPDLAAFQERAANARP